MHIKTLTAATAASLVVATPAMAAPPANDDFADAAKIAVGQEYTGHLDEATSELGEPAGLSHTVWFRYRSPRNAKLTVDAGPDSDGYVAAYTGSDLADLDPASSDNGSQTIRFNARRGRTYRIAVASWYSDPEPEYDSYRLWLSDGGIKGKGIAMTVDPGQTVNSVRSHGLRLGITARRRVGMAVAVRVSRRTARELGLASKTLGSTRGTIDYGQALHATIRLSRAARKALDGAESLHARVRLSLPRSTAPDKVLSVAVDL